MVGLATILDANTAHGADQLSQKEALLEERQMHPDANATSTAKGQPRASGFLAAAVEPARGPEHGRISAPHCGIALEVDQVDEALLERPSKEREHRKHPPPNEPRQRARAIRH